MNAGYGKLMAHALASRYPNMGKLFFVSASSLANWEELSEMFPPGPEGKDRVHTTLQGALDEVEDGGNDLILVAPNHTETITAAGGIAVGTTAAGVTILGLGEADERPLISYTTAVGADLDIGSNGVTFENIRFDFTGVDALTGPIDVNDSGCTFRKCEFITADSGGQAVVGIVTDAAADNLIVEDCDFIGSANAGTVSAIRIVGGDRAIIRRNHFLGNYKLSVGAIEVTTTLAGNLTIEDNTILNNTASSTAAMNFIKGCNVVIRRNVLGIKSGSAPIKTQEGQETGTDAAYLLVGGNYYNNATTVVAGTLL
jgi:hypothetical protein